MRVFVAIHLPADLLAAAVRIQTACQARLPDRTVGWMRPEQIHLTLKFIGHLPEAELNELENALRRACQNKSPLRLCAEGLGCFPDPRRPRVLWVGVGGEVDELRGLQYDVQRETAGWGETDSGEFHPHLTLGRVKGAGQSTASALKSSLDSLAPARLGEWRVDKVHLMQSQLTAGGAVYTSLAAVPLGM